jgi:hypothetical protein
MRRIQRCFSLCVPVVFAIAGISGGGASAASQPTMLQWQTEIGHVSGVGSGCFQASFPALVWRSATCVKAPEVPFAPAASSSREGAPDTVGNGVDYSAMVSGLISKATGSFTGVSPKISEKGQFDGAGSQKANTFSLQLNSEFFSGSPACSGASDPANCLAWQQFIYDTHSKTVFMQYWLIDYDTTCPGSWFTYTAAGQTDCYVNSAASKVSGKALTAKSLATLSLSGTATSGGNDQVDLINGGKATLATGSDAMVDLSAYWNTSEWGVYGDAGGGQANFGKSNTLEAVTTLTATSSSAPTCVKKGFTGETNNLTLTATPALGSESSPTMASKQTDGTAGTASCAVAV